MTPLILLALLFVSPGFAGPLEETRYCTTTPTRDADGSITRRADVRRAFKEIHPCPATGQTRGRCENWEMQHLIPLACGGCDAVSNLYWVPAILKSGPGVLPIDRWELKVYCYPRVLVLVPMPKRQRLHMETP